MNISSKSFKKYIFTIFCFFPLTTSNNQGISCFHKSKHTCLCYFFYMCFIQRWLIAYSEIMLTACTDQLTYNLSLMKLYLACVKQNAVVKTASDACSLSDLVGQCPSSLIVNFEQVIIQGCRNREEGGGRGPCPRNIFQPSESALFQQSCIHYLFSLTQR